MLSTLGAAWTYVYLICTELPKIGERPVSDREKLLGMSGASLLAVFFMSSVGSPMFQGAWRRASPRCGRVPDDLFIDDAAGEGGFFPLAAPPNRDSPGGRRKRREGVAAPTGRAETGLFSSVARKRDGAAGGAMGSRSRRRREGWKHGGVELRESAVEVRSAVVRIERRCHDRRRVRAHSRGARRRRAVSSRLRFECTQPYTSPLPTPDYSIITAWIARSLTPVPRSGETGGRRNTTRRRCTCSRTG